MNSFNNNKGRFMTITYADIRKKKKEIDSKRIDSSNKVTQLAEKLVNEYQKSLNLPSETWSDIQGGVNKYVMVGIYNEGFNFREQSLYSIPVIDYKSIEFDIATVVDDTPRGGDFVVIHICLTVNDDETITVMLPSASDFITVRGDKWDEACNKIKDATYLGIDKIQTII